MSKLTKEEKTILLEYAEWYDSYHSSPEELVQEFEQQRKTNIKKVQKEENKLQALSIEV